MRKIVINGLCTIFNKNYPLEMSSGTLYSANKKFIYSANTGGIYKCFSILHPIDNGIITCFTNCDQNKVAEVLEETAITYSSTNQDIYFPMNLYYLANFFQPDLVLDFDALTLKYNKGFTISSLDNEQEIISHIFSYINSIKHDDIIYYSISKFAASTYSIIKVNKIILDKIYEKTKNIYLGGEFIEGIRPSIRKKYFGEYNISLGKNLSEFRLNECYQELSEDLPIKYNFSFSNTFDPYNAYEDFYPETVKSFNYQINENIYCNGTCAFCINSAKNTNVHSIGDSLSAIRAIESFTNANFTSIILLDPHIVDNRLYKDISKYLINNKIQLDICCGVRLKDLSEEKAASLKDMGVKIANIGVETLDDKQLKYIQKGISSNEIKEKINLLHKYEIFTNINFITGMPYSSNGEIHNSLRWIKDNFDDGVINGVVFNYFQLYYNSEFRRNPDKFSIRLLPVKNSINNFLFIEKEKHKRYNKISIGLDYIKYFKEINFGTLDFNLNLVFYLYKRYKNKNKVWEEYKKLRQTD